MSCVCYLFCLSDVPDAELVEKITQMQCKLEEANKTVKQEKDKVNHLSFLQFITLVFSSCEFLTVDSTTRWRNLLLKTRSNGTVSCILCVRSRMLMRSLRNSLNDLNLCL